MPDAHVSESRKRDTPETVRTGQPAAGYILSLHAPRAMKEEFRECDEHFDSLVATGRMRIVYALTPPVPEGTRNQSHSVAQGTYGPLLALTEDQTHVLATKSE